MKGPAYRVLYSSGEVHTCIQNLFRDADASHRRVALVAYVGQDARAFLPNPKGVHIICCPAPGATSYVGVRRLMDDGAKIEFSNKLHMKVYWSAGRGCLITSANLSTSALGARGLKEAGIFLDDEANVDIDRLIKEAAPYALTAARLETLKKDETKLKGAITRVIQDPDPPQTYNDWFESPRYTPWRLGWWTRDDVKPAKKAKERSRTMFGIGDPSELLNVARGQAHAHEWLLCFKVRNEKLLKFDWMYLDFVVPVDKSERGAYDKNYPFQAIQARLKKQCPTPPFTLNAAFRIAFGKAARSYGIDRLINRASLKPPEKLLAATADLISNGAAATTRPQQRRRAAENQR